MTFGLHFLLPGTMRLQRMVIEQQSLPAAAPVLTPASYLNIHVVIDEFTRVNRLTEAIAL